MATILDKVKEACRVSTNALDNEYTRLIDAAVLDLGIAGVVPETIDELVTEAIITYCKLHSGLPEDAARLQTSYNEQKAQLSNATGYTVWEVDIHV